MKKCLIILFVILILGTGCEKKEDKSTNKNENKQQESSNIDSKDSTVTLGENEYISLKDNKVHKYTFTYPDEATCIKNGDGVPYDVVYPVKPYALFGCEEVKDANGNILWGEYFHEYAEENSIFYY